MTTTNQRHQPSYARRWTGGGWAYGAGSRATGRAAGHHRRPQGAAQHSSRETRKARPLGARVAALAFASALAVGTAAPASAQEPIVLRAGLACEFALRIDISGGNQITKEFFDKNGNLVRVITAGRGTNLTFTNIASGETLELRSNGSVQRTTFYPDGTATVQSTGHNVVILFLTDDPPGPSTTLYTGRLVYTVTQPGDVFTVQSASGRTTDICALFAT
jgi:hypothetical protein